jgi:HK97 family phage major capsid protein
VLAGGGTGQDFAGIVGAAGDDQARSTDSVPDAIHKAITIVRVALEDDITAIALHPNDYERFVLTKDPSSGSYVSGMGPQSATARTIWGYPAVVSTALTEGEAVVGNWRHAYLWLRSGVTLSSGYIDDQLIEDMITMLAEYRAAFAVKRGEAFCTVSDLDVEP